MANQSKIKFVDRDDLLKQIDRIVLKKSDVNTKNAVDRLKAALKAYKRGDKKAMQTVIELRRKMLSAASEVYIELDETKQFDLATAELQIVELIEDEDN